MRSALLSRPTASRQIDAGRTQSWMLLHSRRHAHQRSCHRGNHAIPAAQARTITPYPDPFPELAPGDELPEDYCNPGPNPPKHRRAGVILHPTSLPGKYGIGEIGQEAIKFVDWLAATGMQLWQVRRVAGLEAEPLP